MVPCHRTYASTLLLLASSLALLPAVTAQCRLVGDLVIILDASGSIKNSRGDVATFAQKVVDSLDVAETVANVGLVQFASDTTKLSDLTFNAGALADAIEVYRTGDEGWTFISNGLLMGEQLLDTGRSSVTKVMLLLTDGEQTCSRNPGCVANDDSCYENWDFNNSPLGDYKAGNLCGSDTGPYQKSEAIRQAELIKAQDPDLTLFAVGFGGVSNETLEAIATSGNSIFGSTIQDIIAKFEKNDLCTRLSPEGNIVMFLYVPDKIAFINDDTAKVCTGAGDVAINVGVRPLVEGTRAVVANGTVQVHFDLPPDFNRLSSAYKALGDSLMVATFVSDGTTFVVRCDI
ncbi:hypothetical protein EMIHUDRAFT_199619 [Emiliania huxleyi CCMP1516]|uniref:VWFA domain-containing protein n=2 Tax=Emiliania huxleyi TaxID=2903 RepID=A0A0D3KZX4_EMIH1|nr:hypothetical protein EMIHUDRAFT_199619 [Emiliania huxleyi CCMP1516]EOD41309.1 hypothetical protein EMIHUDRAFT_199619 [Emiliania huxleyi CCMP1516]|eukprot:XP_005793738.1 hypothetical protein EMIHUDRAFT_199619 [Emiliania huxleyi CCMP1516]